MSDGFTSVETAASGRPFRIVPASASFAAALLVATALTPLIFYGAVLYPWVVPRVVYFRLLVEAALAVLVILLLFRSNRVRSHRDWFGAGFLVFLLAGAASAIAGVSPFRSFFGDLERMWGLWGWFHFALFYGLLRVFMTPRGWRVLFAANLAVAIVVVSYGVIQYERATGGLAWLPFEVLDVSYRPAGTLGNPGYLAAYTLAILAVTALLVARLERGRRIWLLPAATLVLLGFVIAQTRGAILGAVAGGVVGVVLYALVGLKGRSRAALLAGAALTLLVAGALVTWARADPPRFAAVPVLSRFSQLGSASDSSRLVIWSAGLDAAQERPILGYGIENYGIAFERNFDPAWGHIPGVSGRTDRAHNALVETAATMGVVGVIAFLLMGLGLVLNVRAAYRRGALSPFELAIVSGLFTAYAVYLVFWFEDSNSLIILFAIAAWVANDGGRTPALEVSERRRRTVSRVVLAIVAGLVIAATAYLHSIRVFRSAAHIHAGIERFESGRVLDGIAELQQASLLAPAAQFHVMSFYGQALELLQPRLDEVRADSVLARRYERALTFGIAAIEDDITRDPLNSFLYMQRAAMLRQLLLYTRDERVLEPALASAAGAVELSPGRLSFRLAYADIYMLIGANDEAEAILREGVRRWHGFGAGYAMLAEIAQRRGDPVTARLLLGEALERGHAPQRVTVAAVAEHFASDDPAGAASLYAGYLERRHAGYLRPSANHVIPFEADTIDYNPPAELDAAELLIAARLPVLLARAGERDLAAATAIRLLGYAPATAPRVSAFIEALRSGSTPVYHTLLPREEPETTPLDLRGRT